MELQPKLLAAADMCEAGEEVNLDELAFLLRYASDELHDSPKVREERDRLLEDKRRMLLARCELLNRQETEHKIAESGSLEELINLGETLDRELRERFLDHTSNKTTTSSNPAFPVNLYKSGR